jgi:hypothetical protein
VTTRHRSPAPGGRMSHGMRAKAWEGQQVQQRVWLGWQFASSEALDEAYVAPFFGAFGQPFGPEAVLPITVMSSGRPY